jgi:hypothetical protein
LVNAAGDREAEVVELDGDVAHRPSAEAPDVDHNIGIGRGSGKVDAVPLTVDHHDHAAGNHPPADVDGQQRQKTSRDPPERVSDLVVP